MSVLASPNLCCACNACSAICGHNAITIAYDKERGSFFPQIISSKCTGCGRCKNVCPASNSFFERTTEELPPLAVYEVYARDKEARWNSASGGAVTTMIATLLDRGLYRQAYVVEFDNFVGKQAVVKAVSSRDELLRAAKSKYIPVSIGPVIEAVRKHEIAGSIIVCTPCQMTAIKNAMRACGVSEDEVLFLGLFCDRMFNYKFYEVFEEKFGKFDQLNFRDKNPGGWPGEVSLIAEGERRTVSRKERIALKKTHTMECCMACPEKLNIKADVSFGDCYTPGYSLPDGKGGVSTLVIRTEKGRRAFDACRELFVVQEHGYDLVRHAQKTIKSEELDSRVYNVCIVIQGLVNRGQGLMFHAILEQVRGRLPNAIVYVDEMAYVAHADFFRRNRVFPLLDPGSIDLVLYAPGYRYSDKFVVKSEKNVLAERKYWSMFTKPGRRIVFLPQAFGPFEGDLTKALLRAAVEHADLIYAREQISSDALIGTLGTDSRIRMAPDFTCLYNECTAELPFPQGKYVVVIPNVQMIAKTSEAQGEQYKVFSKALLRHLLNLGENVVLLNHAKDEELVAELNNAVGGSCKVIEQVSAGACKAIVAASKLTVTSRYHGLVSGLTSGVPTFCTSWSHKYQDLCSRLGCAGNCLPVEDIGYGLKTIENALKTPSDYCAGLRRLEELRDDVYRMWNEIFSLVPDWAVNSKPPASKLITAATYGLVDRAVLSKRDALIEVLRAKVKKRDLLLAKLQPAETELKSSRKELADKDRELRDALAKSKALLREKKELLQRPYSIKTALIFIIRQLVRRCRSH